MKAYNSKTGKWETKAKFNRNDRVIYTTWTGSTFRGTIVRIGEKNDEITYDVDLDNGEGKWGYEDQFELL